MKVVTIGRSSDNTIHEKDPHVSRYHCQITQHDNGAFYLLDRNSENGTFVNGRRAIGEVSLNQNDVVRIGNKTLPWQSYFVGGGGYPPTPTAKNSYGTAALVCGIVGFFFAGIILGVLAIIFGGVSLNRQEKNKGLGVTGLVLGIIDVIIAIIVLTYIGGALYWW